MASRPRRPARNIHRDRRIAVVIAAVFLLPFLFYAGDSLIFLNKIHAGVSVGDQSIGGLVPEEAKRSLDKLSNKNRNKKVMLTWGEQSWSIKPRQIGAKINSRAVVDEAMKIGRASGLFGNIKSKFLAFVVGRDMEIDTVYNDDKLKKFLNNLSRDTNKESLNPTVIIKNAKSIPVEGRSGRKLVESELLAKLPEAFYVKDLKSVKLKVVSAEPEISFLNAKKSAAQAQTMISKPVTIIYADNKWVMDEPKLISFIIFAEEKAGQGKVLNAKLDKPKVEKYVQDITKGITKEPKNAKFAVSGAKAWVVPGQDGIKIDQEIAAEDIEAGANKIKAEDRLVQLKSTVLKPDITTEKANTMGIKERISSYTTTYGSGATSRVSNIHLLTKSLDGTLVAPGAVFSFNKTIGPRTAAKGYKEAPVIQSGKLVPGLGGGVCQVGTTTFNAIFFAGLPVKSRVNHSFYIDHYPKGRDATVSYPYPDLSFQNDTGQYILIKGFYSSNSVTIALYGTDPKREVSFTTTPFSNFKPFPIERIPDVNLDEGKEIIEDKGQQGMTTTVVRIVKKDGQIIFKNTFVSRYRPKIQVVRYGTKKTTKPVTTPGTSSYSPSTSVSR